MNREGRILGSRQSTQTYILTYSRLEKRALYSLGFTAEGPWFLCSWYPTAGIRNKNVTEQLWNNLVLVMEEHSQQWRWSVFAFGEEGVGGEAAVVNKNWYVKNEQTRTSTLWFPVIVPRVNIQADHIQINVNVKIKIKIKGLKTSKNHHLKIESQKPETLKWRAEHTGQTLPNPSNASVATKSQQWKHTHTQSEKQEVSFAS